jgi:hypothetical protein
MVESSHMGPLSLISPSTDIAEPRKLTACLPLMPSISSRASSLKLPLHPLSSLICGLCERRDHLIHSDFCVDELDDAVRLFGAAPPELGLQRHCLFRPSVQYRI